MRFAVHVVGLVLSSVATGQTADVGPFISEIIEGSSYNRAIEVYNPLEEPITLASYVVGHSVDGNCSKSLGSTKPSDIGPCDLKVFTMPISYVSLDNSEENAVLQPGQSYAVCNPRAIAGGPHGGGGGSRDGKEGEGYVAGGGGGGGGGQGMGHPDALVARDSCSTHSHAVAFDGDDAIILARVTKANGGLLAGIVIDVVGAIGGSANAVCGVDNAMTDNTLIRKPSVVVGNHGNWSASSGTSAIDCEWTVEPQDTVLTLLKHTCDLPKNPYVPPKGTSDGATGTGTGNDNSNNSTDSAASAAAGVTGALSIASAVSIAAVFPAFF